MVYKKYIRRGGRLYGPYYYKSERKNGKVINSYVNREDVPAQNETKSIVGIPERTFYLTIIVFGLALLGFLLIYSMQLNGKTTGFFTLGDNNVSENFVDSLTRSALENVEFDWAPGNVCEGASCYLTYVKISGIINAEKSGSANIYLVDGEKKLKILGKDFELETTTSEEIIPGDGTVEEVCTPDTQEVCTPETKEVCTPETKEVCHDETAEDGTVTSICETQETQVCETQETQICTNETTQVCENVTTPGQETIQNVTTEEPEVYSFDEVCDETCALSGFDKTSYKISVELDDGITADITSISYQWENVAVIGENESIPIEPLLNETLLNETFVNETGNFNWTTTILNNYGNESKEISVKISLPLSLKNSTDEIDSLSTIKKDKNGKEGKVILSAENNNKLKSAKEKIKNFTKGKYNEVYLSPDGSAIKNIKFKNLAVENDTISLGISGFSDARYVQTYAIDPTQVNFTSADVTVTAVGSELLKCKDWNFTSQTCFGNWVKIMDIIPGQEYTFTLTAEDPGFGEIIQDENKVLDTYLDQNSATTNYGSNTALGIDSETNKNLRPLLRFNLSIDSSAKVDSAKLKLYMYASAGANISVTVYRLTKNWTEAAATWNKFNSSTNWATAGGDYAESYDLQTLYDAQINQWYIWNITGLVQGWINGSYPNYGLILVGSGATNNQEKFFYSTNYATNTSLRPILEINYTIGPTVNIVSLSNGNVTTLNSVNFICNASVSTNQLSNITFYWNYSGSFVANETQMVSGTSNQTRFARASLNNGAILWNCLACNNASQCSFASANWTVIVNSSAPDITPPLAVSNLINMSIGTTWIYWNWTNPGNSDFDVAFLYLDGINVVNLTSPINYYNATGLLSGVNYTLTINTKDINGNVNYTNVSSSAKTISIPVAIISETSSNSSGVIINTTLVLISDNGTTAYNNTNLNHTSSTIQSGYYTIIIQPINYSVYQVVMSNAYIGSNTSKIVDFDSFNVANMGKAFAINPYVNFSSANVTLTAAGIELMKCSNWSFATQQCIDNSWTHVMDLTAGQNYTFAITNGDPGFIELTRYGCTAITCWNKAIGVACTCAQVGSDDATLASGAALSGDGGSWAAVLTEHINSTTPAGKNVTAINAGINWYIDQLATSTCTLRVYKNTTATWYTFNTTCQTADTMYNYNLSNWINTTQDAQNVKLLINMTGAAGAPNEKLYVDMINVTLTWADITPPVITLNSPAPGYPANNNSLVFNWSVYDNIALNSTCNLTIDSIVNKSNILILNGSSTAQQVSNIVDGLHYWNVTCVDDGGNNPIISATRNFTIDTTPPYFVTIPASTNINYTQGFNVQFSAADNVAFGSYAINWTTLFAINSTGRLYNTTQLAAGTYNINVTINDTLNNLNSTIYQVVVNKAVFSLGISGTTPIGYGNTTDVAGSGCPSGLTCSLSPSNAAYGAGTVTFNYSTAGNTNYSANSITKDIVIDKANPSAGMNITGTTPIIYPATSDFAGTGCPSQLTCSLDKANATYGAGTTTFNYSTPGNANYSAGSVTKNLVVQQNTTYVLGISGTTPIIYGNTTDVAGSGCPSGLTCSLSPSNAAYGAGTVTFNYSTAGNTNYSANSITKDIVIDKATSTLTFLANGGTSNLTLESPQQVNISAVASAGTIGLDKDGVNYLANNSLDVTLPIGSYIFRANITGNQNYSDVGYSYYNITIQDTTKPAVSIVYPHSTTYNDNVSVLNYTVSDANLQACWYSLNNGTTNSSVPGGCGNNLTGLTSLGGNNTWIVWANDSVGNVNSSSVTFNVYICAQNITYTDWSEWQNGTCAIDQMNQSRSRVEYDSNDCGGFSNVTHYDYNLTGPTYDNTGWGDWTNITCLSTNYQNQSRNSTQFDIYGCASNSTNFEYRDNVEGCDFNLVPPTLSDTSIVPYDPAIWGNVSLSANATDINGVSGIFANITWPNGTVVVLTLPANYTVQSAGRYNVTFWANDTLGNVATFEDYFIGAESTVSVTFNTVDSNMNGILVNLTVYFTGTDKEVHEHDFTGILSDEHGNLMYDLYYVIIGANSSVRLNGVNLSLYNDSTLGFDRNTSILDYLVVYGLNSTYGFDNATLVLSYGGLAFSNEDNLVLEKCDDWDFVARICLGTWNDITLQATQDEIGHTFTVTVNSFSGFGIIEVAPTTPATPTGEGGRGGYFVNGTPISPGTPEIPGAPEEVPWNPIKEIENALKTFRESKYGGYWIIFLLVAIWFILLIILLKRISSVKNFFKWYLPADKVKHTEGARLQKAAELEHSLGLKFRRFFRSIGNIFVGIFEGVAGFAAHFVAGVRMLVFGIANVFSHLIKGIFEFVGSIIYGIAFFFQVIGHQIVYFVSGLVELSRSFVYGMEKSFARFVVYGLKMFSLSVLHGIVGIFEGFAGLINSIIDGTRKMLARIARGITGLVNGIVGFVLSLVKGVLAFFILFGISIVIFFKRIIEFMSTSSHKVEHDIKLTERRAFRRLSEQINDFASSSAEGVKAFFSSLVYLIQHDARVAERRYARRIIKREQDLASRIARIVENIYGEIVKIVQTFIYELKRTFKSIYSRFGMLLKHEEMKPRRKEEPSEEALPEGFDFNEKDIIALNAKRIRLEQYIKNLDLEYKRGTLDTKGYIRTRENLLKELWKLKH